MRTSFRLSLVAGAVLLGAGIVALVVVRNRQAPPTSPAPVTVAPTQVAPSASTAPTPPADCHLPGPAPAMPDGHTAGTEAMRQGHDNIQAFVLQLEAYQACRNSQIDHAAPDIPMKQKQEWVDEGNDAVDQANALARAFSAQIKIFKARMAKK